MVAKPMSQLLSKSVGHGDRVLPGSLVNSGARSSSVKKTRSLKARSPERGEVVAPTPAAKRGVRAQELRSTKGQQDVDTGVKFEKFEQQLDHHEGGRENGVLHPSLHSPMMLSTKGHAVSRDSLEDLSSLRNRLAGLRGSGEGGGEEQHGGGKNWGYGRNVDQNGSNGEVVSSGYGDGEGRKGARSNALEHLSRTRSNDMEKLSNGSTRMHEKKESPRVGSRGRHKQQPSTMEFLSNGDVQMMYEAPDDVLNTSTNSNPRNGTIHETGEKPRRAARNRIHHHQESLQQMRGGGRGGMSEDRIANMKLVSSGSGNLRVQDSPGGNAKSSSAAIDDLNRIHQRLNQSAEARDSPRSNLVVENGGATRPGVVVDVREHLEDRLRQRRSNSAQSQNLHLSHENGSRVASHRSSMQSSGDRSPHKQQSSHRSVNYQSSYERDEQSAEREREPLNERSTQQTISPSRQHQRLQLLASYRSSYEGDEPQNSRNGNVGSSEQRGRARDAGLARRGPKPGQTWFAATELQSNLLVEVADCRFHLHKFPLLSRSGRLNRLVFESRDTNKDHIKLPQMPGGAEAFELCVKFCYGIPVELTPQSVATLRCAAEYLEMADSLEDGNLVSKTEHYLSFVILASWKDSIAVLQSCQRLLPWAEETQIVRRCSESVAWKACTDQHGIKWSFTSTSNVPTVMWNGGKQTQVAQHIPHDWWVEDVIQLNLEAFGKVITAVTAKGMAYTLVGSAIAQYATRWIPGVEKKNRKHQQQQELAPNSLTGKEIVLRDGQNHAQSLDQDENRELVEGVAAMLPPQQDGVSCSFLLRLLRAACAFGASTSCREELERRVGLQLEQASLSDLLIPSSNPASPTMYDLDVVQRILEQFLLKDQTMVSSPTMSVKTDKQLHVFENGVSKPPATPSMTKTKVAKLMDAYLAEVARDANLPLARFQNLAESLPQFSRATDDGLYRAVDTYLKAHPTMTEHERKKLCRVMDCQRLSLEACLHAAQNERLPLRVVVQVLFSEQVKLRNAITGGNTSKKTRDHHTDGSAYSSARDHSQIGGQSIASRVDDTEADGLSLHESWLAARQDIKFLKQDMERMKAKYADLEQESQTQQVEKKPKPKTHSSSGWTSGWRKLSSTLKPPSLFHTSKTEFDYTHKDDASIAPTHASGDVVEQSTYNTPRAPADQRRRSHSVTSTSSVQRWRNSIS
ncbi:hypothetical protein M758_3G092100 [Ceratodon purpureus]|nr:hypothetical protein M758_3G092100 [Ceratodon purpureus]